MTRALNPTVDIVPMHVHNVGIELTSQILGISPGELCMHKDRNPYC